MTPRDDFNKLCEICKITLKRYFEEKITRSEGFERINKKDGPEPIFYEIYTNE